jgi:V/A-type H+-transporting ATPase subunit C
MMNQYAYLNARVSILAGRLIPETQLMGLLNQPLSSIGGDLEELFNEKPANHTIIEQAWLMRMLADFQVLVRPLSGRVRELFMYWFHKRDITNLKTIIRGKVAKLNTATISKQLLNLSNLSALPIQELLRTEDIGELLRQLEKTPYASIARQARRVYEKEHQIYSLDAAIDRHYLLGFVQRVQAIESNEQQHFLPLIKIIMDRFNLIWLLRYRFAYQLSAAETYYLLVPKSSRFNRQLLQILVELDSLPEVLANLPEPLYTLLLNAEDTLTVEKRLIMEVQRIAKLTLTLHQFSLAKAFAYILLREIEMRQVMAVVKGKQMKLKNEIILSGMTSPIL